MSKFLKVEVDENFDDYDDDEVDTTTTTSKSKKKNKTTVELRREQLQTERLKALKLERSALARFVDNNNNNNNNDNDDSVVDDLLDRLVKCERVQFESLRLIVQLGAQYPTTKPTFDCDRTLSQRIAAHYQRHQQQKQPLLLSKLLKLLTEEKEVETVKLQNNDTSTSSTTTTTDLPLATFNSNDVNQFSDELAKSCEDSMRTLRAICDDLNNSSVEQTNAKKTLPAVLDLTTIVGVVVAAMLDAPDSLVAKLWRLAAKAAISSKSSSISDGTKTRAFNQASQDPNAFDSRFNELMLFLLQRYNNELYQKFVNFDEAKHQHSRINRSLVVGSLASSRDKPLLLKEKIVAIVSVGGFTPLFPDEWKYLQFKNVKDRADQNLRDFFIQSNRFVSSYRPSTSTTSSSSSSSSSRSNGSNNSVLIHCFGGRSRSIVFATAYLIEHERMSMNEALATIANSRPIISPNAGFLQQLRWFNDRFLREQELLQRKV